jgi:hypothetical protein
MDNNSTHMREGGREDFDISSTALITSVELVSNT